jgi:uncharacterized protein (TIGR03437 family)
MMRHTTVRLLAQVALIFVLGAAFAVAASAQSYGYDAAGRLIRAVYPQGGGVAYAYDAADNLTTVMPLATLPAPVDVQVTRLSETSARISWQADPAATGYVVERRVLGETWEQIATLAGNASVYIDTAIEAATDYEYRVRAVNGDGESAPSAAATFSGPPQPSISENGIVNGASFASGRPVAPGSIVSVFGENIGIRVTESGIESIFEAADEVPLSTELGRYSLLFGDVEAPLFFVGGEPNNQINAQVPWEVPLGESQVRVVFDPEEGEQQVSDPVPVPVAIVSPALFTFEFGAGRVAALNVKVSADDGVINGSVAQPEGIFPGVPSQPAKLGGVVTLFANGLGPTEPAAVTADNSLDALRSATVPVRVFVGEAEAQVLFAGLAPEFVGLCQINFVVPLGVAPGNAVPIVIEQGGVMSRDDVTIALRP